METYTSAMCREWEILEHSNLTGISLSNPLSQAPDIYMEGDSINTIRARDGGLVQGNNIIKT